MTRFLAAVLTALSLTFTIEAAEEDVGRSASPVYETVLVRGGPAVVVDGDLSDWDRLDLIEAPINVRMTVKNWLQEDRFGMETFEGPQDLSASFRAVMDSAFLYVGVRVTDEALVFGEYPVWQDDGLHLLIDGDLLGSLEDELAFDANDAKFDVSRRGDETTITSRFVLADANVSIPYLAEGLGVRAAIVERSDGWAAEMRVPAAFFGLERFAADRMVGMNVAVTDDDDGGEDDHRISWTGGDKARAELRTAVLGRVVARNEVELGAAAAAEEAWTTEAAALRAEGLPAARRMLAAAEANPDDLRRLTLAAGLAAGLAEGEGLYQEALRALTELSRHAPESTREMNWAVSERMRVGEAWAAEVESSGDLKGAIRVWEQVARDAKVSSDRAMIRSYQNRVRLLDEVGESDRADKLRREFLSFSSRVAEGHTHEYVGRIAADERLQLRLHFGEVEEARKEVETFVRELGDNELQVSQRLGAFAYHYRTNGHPDEAVPLYKRALKHTPTEDTAAQAEFGLGYIYYKQHRFTDAEPYLEAVFQKREQLGMFEWMGPASAQYLATLYLQTGRPQSAVGMFQAVVDEFPESRYAFSARRFVDNVRRGQLVQQVAHLSGDEGQIELLRTRRPAEVREMLAQEQPNAPLTLLLQAQHAHNLGDTGEAAERFRQAVYSAKPGPERLACIAFAGSVTSTPKTPEEMELLRISHLAVEEKRSEGLVERLEEELETQSGNAQLYYELGYARIEVGDHAGAIEALEAGRRINPVHGKILTELMYANVHLENIDAAEALLPDLELVLGEAPFIRHELGYGYARVGRIADAVATFEALIEDFPGRLWSYYTLADILRDETGDIERARSLMKTFLEKARAVEKPDDRLKEFMRRAKRYLSGEEEDS